MGQKITIAQALARYGQECGPVARPQHLRIIQRYLESGHTATEGSLRAYLQDLARRGYQSGTIDRHLRILRAFYRVLHIPLPRVEWTWDSLQDSDRPALSIEACQTLMALVRDPASLLSEHLRAVLLISLIYGPRVNELAAIQSQDVESERLYIRTSKGGAARWLWIAPQMRPFLIPEWPSVTTSYLNTQFQTIWHLAFDSPKPPRVAWHSIRRALVRDLGEVGISDSSIGLFMRWAAPAGGGYKMVARYKQPSRIVDGTGTVTASPNTTLDLYQVDQAVWDNHPRLK